MKSYGLSLLLLLLTPKAQVQSYGTPGHRIVANLAWKLVSNETQHAIASILKRNVDSYSWQMIEICGDNEEPCTLLGSVAEWADDMKEILGDKGPPHSIQVSDPIVIASDKANTSINETSYAINYTKDCPDDRCILGAIVKFADAMTADFAANSTNSSTSLHESIMFLTHLLGDLHEPLHAGRLSDQNGLDLKVVFMDSYNPFNSFPAVCLLPQFLWPLVGCDAKLHIVWDWSILAKTMQDDFGGSRSVLEQDIWKEYIQDNDTNRNAWLSCFANASGVRDEQVRVEACVLEWANESYELAEEYAYQHVDGTDIVEGDYLGEDYYGRSLPIIRRALAAGAVRLAHLLDILLLPSGPWNKG